MRILYKFFSTYRSIKKHLLKTERHTCTIISPSIVFPVACSKYSSWRRPPGRNFLFLTSVSLCSDKSRKTYIIWKCSKEMSMNVGVTNWQWWCLRECYFLKAAWQCWAGSGSYRKQMQRTAALHKNYSSSTYSSQCMYATVTQDEWCVSPQRISQLMPSCHGITTYMYNVQTETSLECTRAVKFPWSYQMQYHIMGKLGWELSRQLVGKPRN